MAGLIKKLRCMVARRHDWEWSASWPHDAPPPTYPGVFPPEKPVGVETQVLRVCRRCHEAKWDEHPTMKAIRESEEVVDSMHHEHKASLDSRFSHGDKDRQEPH